MFFHPEAVSDATAQSLLFHVHVSVTAVGSDQCPYINGLPRPRSRFRSTSQSRPSSTDRSTAKKD